MSKRIIIKESSLYKMREQLNEEASSTNLPRFLFDDVKEHNTSLGDSKAFPNFGHYPYDYKITKMRYLEVKETIESLVGEKNPDINTLLSDVSKLTKKAIEIERPIRDNLVKLCENVVTRLFLVPEDTIVLDLSLVDKLEPRHPFMVHPEDGDYKFKSSEDAENAANAIEKRRFIDALIQGAATEFSKNIAYYSEELDEINGELGELYEKIIAINNYLLFVKQEKIKDDKPMQGGFVEVELGTSEEKTIITAQGLIFPYLLHEAVRGLFELFASKGLPQDNRMAKYVVQNADFILAEPWDLRLGCTMWSTITNNIEDTKIIPFFFSELCQLPMEEFNKKVKEILGCTEEGDEYSRELINVAKEQFEMSDFEHMVAKKNSEAGLISDEYISSDELDNYMIDEPKNIKGTIEEDEINEYSTPDELNTYDVRAYWGDRSYPFVVLNDSGKTILIGKKESSHNSMKCEVISKLTNVDLDIVYSILKSDYTDMYDYFITADGKSFSEETRDKVLKYEKGRVLNKSLYLLGRFWPNIGDNGETYISIWLNGRFISALENVGDYSLGVQQQASEDDNDAISFDVNNDWTSRVSHHIPSRIGRDTINTIIRVLKTYGIESMKGCYLALGNSVVNLEDLENGKSDASVSSDDEERFAKQRNIHLMNQQDKRKALSSFRDAKNRVWQSRFNQTPSKTGAEWHNMVYQEGVVKENSVDEYSTPDKIDTSDYKLSYKDGGIPFIVMNDRDKTVFFGDEEQTHNEMKLEIIAFEVDATESTVESIVKDEFYPVYDEDDEPIDDYYTNDDGEEFDGYTISCVKEYYDDANMLNKCAYLFGRMWPWCGEESETFISIWLNGRFYSYSEDDDEEYYSNIDGDNEDGVEMNISDYDEFGDEVYEGSRLPKRLSRDVIETLVKVAREYGIDDLEKTYLCIGDTNITLFDLYYGKEKVEVSQEDERESANQRNIHLMNQQDKRNALQNFRQNKNAIWQQKYNQTPSKTGAEWHNMMYQEGVIRESIGDEHKISFKPQKIENNCYQMHVLLDGEEFPVEYINFYVNPREIQGQTLYQPHIFIAPELQRHGFAFAIYKQFIREYGNLYSGKLRCMNTDAINPLYEKLGRESDINVDNVTDADGNVIGTLAWLA